MNKIFVKENNIFAATVDKGLFLSTDNGDNWKNTTNNLGGDSVTALASKDSFMIVSVFKKGMYFSSDNGSSWVAKNNGLLDSIVWTIAVSGNNIYIGTYSKGIFISSDNGENWIQKNEGLKFKDVFVISINGDSIYAGGYTGFAISTDNGNNWNTRMSMKNEVRALAFKENIIFAGSTYENGIFVTTNNGDTWNQRNTGLPYDRSISALVVYENYIFAAVFTSFGLTNRGGVVLSSDNGYTWLLVSDGLNNRAVITLAIHGDYIFCGTSDDNLDHYSGVYRAKIKELLPTDVKEEMDKLKICVSPNPATDFIDISLGASSEPTLTNTIKIYNVFGQNCDLTPTLSTSGEGVRIDVSSFPTGMYFVRIGDRVSKFVKL